MSFNYKNVKFAVDHLTFKKVINSILEILTTIKNKITNLSESIGEQIFSNNVLVLDESNWDQYITPRPKIVGLAGDGEHEASIVNNPFNQESCFYVAIERDTYIDSSVCIKYEETPKSLTKDFLEDITVSNGFDNGSYFRQQVLDEDNWIYNSRNPTSYFEPYKAVTDINIIKDAANANKFVKVLRGRLNVPKKYKTIQFNFKYISFVGLSIVPEGFVENLEDTDDETNQNKKLNGTEINIFQSATSGIDISSFRSLGDKTSDGDNLTIKERVISLSNEKGKIGAYKKGARFTSFFVKTTNEEYLTEDINKNKDGSSFIDYHLDGSVTHKETSALKINSETSCIENSDTSTILPTYFLNVPFWGGLVADSVNQHYSYNNYDYYDNTTCKYYTNFDNLINISYCNFTGSETEIWQEEILGTYVAENNNTSTGTTKRLRPGRETKLIWYNGFWFYC
jgi:hypothetical protein